MVFLYDADPLDICDFTFVIFGHAQFPFQKCVRKSAVIWNTRLGCLSSHVLLQRSLKELQSSINFPQWLAEWSVKSPWCGLAVQFEENGSVKKTNYSACSASAINQGVALSIHNTLHSNAVNQYAKRNETLTDEVYKAQVINCWLSLSIWIFLCRVCTHFALPLV